MSKDSWLAFCPLLSLTFDFRLMTSDSVCKRLTADLGLGAFDFGGIEETVADAFHNAKNTVKESFCEQYSCACLTGEPLMNDPFVVLSTHA